MSQQKQHILLSYFKTRSVDQAGVEPATSRSPKRRFSNWAELGSGTKLWFLGRG